jgi:biopolymer transport protein TolR
MAVSLEPLGGGGRRRSGPRFRPRAEINVTPFIDVVLVLLIVFMVAAPLLTAGELVQLPKTNAKSLPSDDKPLAVQVLKDGRVTIQEQEYQFDELVPKLKAIAVQAGKTAKDKIYVYGDEAADYGAVMKVLSLIRDAGFPNVALVTDPRGAAAADADASGGKAGGKTGKTAGKP